MNKLPTISDVGLTTKATKPLKPEKTNESPKTTEPSKPNAPLTEEERNELRRKMRDNRNHKIAARKKKSKQKSKPLIPIYYCDAENCMEIMEQKEAKACPICRSFHYCSAECQAKHWSAGHKALCGKNPTEEFQARLALYHKAKDAAEELFQFFKDGNYVTVMHEPLPAPAAIFATLAEEKSNVLNWKMYLKQNMFTTSALNGFGSLSSKVQAAMAKYGDEQIYAITVIFERLRNEGNTEAVIRFFRAEGIGEKMDAPIIDGKISKQVIKYKRK